MDENESDLRPLTAAETALIEAHPLPPGVPDALLNKAQLETALSVSGTTISTWLRRPENPLTYETAGANGRSYQFRLSLAYAWMRAMRDDEDRAKAAGDAAAAQMSLALLGGETASGTPGKMSLADQRKLLELEALRRTEARNRRELIRRDDVVTGVEDIFAAIRDALDALPDRLARELGAEGRDLEKIERACDDVLTGAARVVERLVDDGEGDGSPL